METGTDALSLDDFICEMSREPVSALTHERLMDLTGRLRLSDDLIAGRTRFALGSYARNLVCRTETFELLVLCWLPGQASTIHDHAGSLNAIRVHRGELTSRVFAPAGAAGGGPMALVREDRVRPGQKLVGVDRGGIHQLADTSGADLVTVHVYAPALTEINVYALETAQVERRTLRYTFADDLA